MTTPSLADLYTAKTRDEVLAVILEVAAALDLPIEAWQPGGVGRELLTIVAQSEANLSQVAVVLASLGLLDYASGTGLTLLAKQLYDVDRIEATNGTATERVTNSTGIAYPLNAGDLRFYSTDGHNYTSTTGGTLPAHSFLDVTVQADLAGTGSNAAVDQINQLATPIQGVTCTNTEPLVGTDEEPDAALRIRCKESLAKASPNGPRDAYNYFAKTTLKPDGSNVGITRTAVNDGIVDLTATIIVYIAQADGPVDLDNVALVNTNIQANCVPTGFTATVVSATEHLVPVTATVYLSRGSTLDSAQATTLVQAKLLEYFGTVPIGGYNRGLGGKVFREAITGQIFQASPQFIEVTLTAPASDVSLAAYEVAVLDTVTITAIANVT